MASTINAKNTSTGVVITPDSSGQLELQTADTTRMTIDVNGNVGIGTTSPAAYSGYKNLAISGSTGGVIDLMSGSTVVGELFNTATDVRLLNNTATGSSQFWTNGSERMRIDSNGNLRVGTNSFAAPSDSRTIIVGSQTGSWNQRTLTIEGTNQPAIGFHAPSTVTAGIFKFWGAGNQFECRNSTDGGFIAILASAFTVSSDYRVKTDIVELDSVLPNVLALRPVNYEKDGVQGREYGLIAHEAAEHFPELVHGEKDAMREDDSMDLQTVNYMALSAVLVKAIQEQQAIINDLKARIETLEGASA